MSNDNFYEYKLKIQACLLFGIIFGSLVTGFALISVADRTPEERNIQTCIDVLYQHQRNSPQQIRE